ncbi:MAG: DUF1566 domain-containing protein [Ignavibacteriales bacterium]|nr:DUF1566 domain-containing protein [Ignavibacteriales bacterium]
MTTQKISIRILFFTIFVGSIAWSQAARSSSSGAQTFSPRKLPDTGQITDYTPLPGEDSDFLINAPSYTNKNDGTILDNITGLMWQQGDGGEMTFEKAGVYCDTLTLGGYTDWRLPTGFEIFGILNHDKLNPAMDVTYFPKTLAEYWWSSEVRVDDATKVWAANAGGGIGAHPKTETVSAGGTKKFHVRAVRNTKSPVTITLRYVDNGNGMITDRATGLIWQKVQPSATMTWDNALKYSDTLSLGGQTDWRIPNIKELQSINDPGLAKPSIDRSSFTSAVTGRYWSSTSQYSAATRAWFLDCEYGIVSYDLKTVPYNVLCVRGRADGASGTVNEALVPGGEFEMGDHFGFVDPSHPSDELPIHQVKVNSFYMATTETSNKQSMDLLNAAFAKGLIEVRGNIVFLTGKTDTLCYLNQFASYSSIGWDGKSFSIVDFRADHPMVGVMWNGAAALCNWISAQNGLQECFNLNTWECDFTKNGYRLPTEAEWEYTGRGGHLNPYYNYPNGNTIDVTSVNLPASGDPYETGNYPNTTPVGFYDGKMKLKSEFNWPGSAASYQTANGANAFGLYDMQGNVWEFIYDWYGQNYYSVSPSDNPKGPASGFIMPDGKPYRGMRGGNWYNGLVVNGINDGHSRVSNRNPSYYRGPQDPNHPYYHLGFRFARNYSSSTGVERPESTIPTEYHLYQNYPNPFNPSTTIKYYVPHDGHLSLKIFNTLGQEISNMIDGNVTEGLHEVVFNANQCASGVLFCRLQSGGRVSVMKMILVR